MFSRLLAKILFWNLCLCYYATIVSGSSSRNTPFRSLDTVCGPPPTIQNAYTNATSSQETFQIGTVVHYRCSAGSVRSGRSDEPDAVCVGRDGDATWNGPFISCPNIICGDPGTVENSDRDISSVSYGSYATFHCREGYSLSGRNQRFCQSDGRWSGTNPVCNIVTCRRPEDPVSGNAIYSSLTFGSEAVYECSGSRILKGIPRRYCLASGIWNGTVPTCEFADCGLPPDNFTSGYARLSNTNIGQVVDYECEDGSIKRSFCLPSGGWNPSPPDCMYIVPSTTVPSTGRESRRCSGRFSCFFYGIRRGICSGLRKIGIRLCKAD